MMSKIMKKISWVEDCCLIGYCSVLRDETSVNFYHLQPLELEISLGQFSGWCSNRLPSEYRSKINTANTVTGNREGRG